MRLQPRVHEVTASAPQGCSLGRMGRGAAAARLGREQEDEKVRLRVVDLVDHLGALFDRARAVELAARPPLELAHAFEEVERLRCRALQGVAGRCRGTALVWG